MLTSRGHTCDDLIGLVWLKPLGFFYYLINIFGRLHIDQTSFPNISPIFRFIYFLLNYSLHIHFWQELVDLKFGIINIPFIYLFCDQFLFILFLQSLFTHWRGSIFTTKKKQRKSRMIRASFNPVTRAVKHCLF